MNIRNLLIPIIIGSAFLSADGLGGPACEPDATTLCLFEGRFSVTAQWEDPAESEFSLRTEVASGDGLATSFSRDTGYWWSEGFDSCG